MPKKTRQLNVMWSHEWDPGPGKQHEAKTKEIAIKYGLQLMIMYPYRFIGYNKCTTLI